LKAASDRSLHVSTLLLQVATVVALLWIGFGMQRQAELTSKLINQETPPMTTPYTDIYGLTHEVSSPVQSDPDENVRVHKRYLIAAFCEWAPANPPKWWSPSDCASR
jgi:hypothetical protein